VAIGLERSPAGKAQPTSGPRRSQQIGESRPRIGKKHDAKPRGDQAEAVGLEFMGLRVGLCECDVAQPGLDKALACARQHRRRDIGAQHLTVLADCLGERNRKSARATADLEHPLAGGNPRTDQQQIIDRLHPPLDKAFKPDPARAGDRVPIFPLRRIGCRAHTNAPQSHSISLVDVMPDAGIRSGRVEILVLLPVAVEAFGPGTILAQS